MRLRRSQPGIDFRVGSRNVDLLDETFLQRNDPEKGVGPNERVLVVDPVQREVVKGPSSSIDGSRASASTTGHASLRERQLGHVASIQGKLLDLLSVEVGADFRVGFVDDGLHPSRSHDCGLIHCTHLKDNVNGGGCIQLDLHSFNDRCFEAG